MIRRRLKIISFILVVSLMLFGCQTVQVNMKNPDGETTPKPFYRSTSTHGSQLQFTWFYVKHEGRKDIDGTILKVPTYLDPKGIHNFDIKKIYDVKMVLRVHNPRKEQYKVYESKNIEYRKRGGGVSLKLKGESNAEYREWIFNYPVDKYVRQFSTFTEVMKEGGILTRTTRFSYTNIIR